MRYPVQLDLTDRMILLVGAGSVASRKCKDLLSFGAKVKVVAPRGKEPFHLWEQEGKISWERRSYEVSDLADQELVFVATDDEEINKKVVSEALEKKLWVNSADGRYPGNFTLPGKHLQGDLLLTVSTNGHSPGVARQIKEELKENYGPIWQEYLNLIGELRRELLSQKTSQDREAFWRDALTPELLGLVRAGLLEEVEAKIRDAAGRFRD